MSRSATAEREGAGYASYQLVGPGWRAFAGTMILIAAAFTIINALVAISDANYFQRLAADAQVHLPLTDEVETWGWVHLVVGGIMLLAGAAIFYGSMWARILGVLAVAVNMLVWFTWLAAFPIWGLVMIVIDSFVLYALIVHGNPETDTPL
jgi:hypothetical protein